VKRKDLDRRVLVFAVHPDDETLGAGGTLLKLRESGAATGWLILTHMSEAAGWEPLRIQEREREIAAVSDRFEFDYVRNIGLRPAEIDTYTMGELVRSIREALIEWEPDTVILPYWEDAHTDHRLAFAAAKSCLKKFRAPQLRRVYAMEVVSETNFGFPGAFKANVYSDVSDTLEAKIEIMRLYASELQEHPFPRSPDSIRALATLRGSEAGVRYAEAFHLITAYDGVL
jgi:LmbE family N-acetylglucosaminyl deacetylase